MRKILLALSVIALLAGTSFGQPKLKTKSGNITFEASVPSFEEVKASNENVSAILNTETGEFAALALMKGFRFKVALMEEHFNENYVESSTYPKSVFKGTISNFDSTELDDSPGQYEIKGSVTLHGVSREIVAPVKLWKENGSIMLSTTFSLKPSDFNIKIPAVVSKKIAEDVHVEAKFSLSN